MANKARPFWERVIKTDTCWLWSGPPRSSNSPYGYIRRNGKNILAHRYAYEDKIAPIPAGMTVDHLCKNTMCVNPAHMELVTLSENVRRSGNFTKAVRASAEKQLAKTHCPKGHEYTPENLYKTIRQRHCKACRNEAQRRFYWRNKNV